MWLQEYSKAADMTLDQLLEDVLEHYYKVWRVSYKKACLSTLNLEESLKAFLETPTGSQRMKGDYVVRQFITWLCEKNAPVSRTSIDEFIEQYKSERDLKYSTISSYKSILRRFVEFHEKRVRPGIFNHKLSIIIEV